MAGLVDALSRRKLGDEGVLPIDYAARPTLEEARATNLEMAGRGRGDIGLGLSSAVRGMVGSTKAYAASGLEALGAKDAAQGVYRSANEDAAYAGRLAPEIATTDQITDFNTAARYVGGKIGQGFGSIPLGLAGGVGGRLLLGSGAGALAGATAAYQPVMAGGHIQELNANEATAGMDPTEKFWRGTGVGTAQAVAEGVGPAYLGNRFFKHKPPATSLGGAVKNFGKELGINAALEGGGAAVSDVLGQGGMMHADPALTYNPRQTFEAGFGEAIGGAGVAAPGVAGAHGMDYLAAGAGAAKDEAEKRMPGALDATRDMGGKAVDAAKGAAQTVSDAGSLFKNTARGYLKHPELAKLVAAQERPPELDGATAGEIMDWFASDNNTRRDAALKIAQRTLIDREAGETEKAVAQALLDNPNDPEAWKPFAEGVVSKHQTERLAIKAGKLQSTVSGWVDEVRGKTKSNMENSQQDATYLGAMRPTIVRATGVKDESVVDQLSDGVRKFLLSSATRDEAGWERLPTELVEAFGESTPEVLAKSYDALRRQGLTRDIETKQELTFYTPEVAQRVVDKQLAVRNQAAEVVDQNLVLEALPLMPKRGTQDFQDLTDGLRDYVRRGKADEETEQYLDQLFGPNKDTALEQLVALDTPVQSQLAKGSLSSTRIDRPEDTDAMLTKADGETGSDAQGDPTDEYDSTINELNNEGDTRYFFKGQKNEAFDTEDAFLDKNLDTYAHKKLDPRGRALKYDRAAQQDKLRLDRIGVMDYASETGDRRLLDELLTKHPDLTHEQINQRFFVAKNEASEVDQGEAVDVRPEDLQIGANKKGTWQARTRIDRPPEKGGNIDTSTLEHGRVYLTGDAHKTPFVTSSRVLIEQMWDRKKLGAFDENTSDKVGADDKLAMFAAGLTSVLDAGRFTKIEIKTPDGEMFQVDALDGLPDNFVIWPSNNPDARLTLGQAKGLTNKAFRAKKQKELKQREGGEPLPKQWVDEVWPSDIPGMSRAELEEATQAIFDSIAAAPTKAISERLSKKYDTFKEALDNRVGERAPGDQKETADAVGTRTVERQDDGKMRGARTEHHGVSETEEMAEAKAKEHEKKERKFDEETHVEVQPHGYTASEKLRGLEGRINELRRKYAEVNKELTRLEGATGKNAVREGKMRALAAELADIKSKGVALKAKVAEMKANEAALDKKSATFQQKQKVDAKREAAREAVLKKQALPKERTEEHARLAKEKERSDELDKQYAAEQQAEMEAAGQARLPGFLRDTQGESTGTPTTDADSAKDIAYLEATIAAHHGEKTAAGVYEAATLPDHAALDQIAKAFGARVRGFKVTGDKAKYGFFSGVYQGGNRDVVYLSDAAKRPHMALLGHELVHRLRKTNPALYAKFEALVSKHIKPDAYKAWSKMFNADGKLTDAALREEFMAEVVSDGMMDRTFWEALAKKDVNLAKQVYASVMRLFKQIMASVGYTPKTKSVLDDYAAVMKIAGEVMAEHGATSLRTMNESSVRDTTGAKFHRNANEIHDALGKQGFAATHDSPIKHEGKFNWRQFIGKGEGNAAFGAGTYLSTADGVHRSYKRMFTAMAEDGQFVEHISPDPFVRDWLQALAESLAADGTTDPAQVKEAVLEDLRDQMREYEEGSDEKEAYASAYFRAKEMVVSAFALPKGGKSPTYQVSVNIKPEEMLDWDKPLNEQKNIPAAAIEKAALRDIAYRMGVMDDNTTVSVGWNEYSIRQVAPDKYSFELVNYLSDNEPATQAEFMEDWAKGNTGAELYQHLSKDLGSQAAASDYLQSLGILGHKYNAAGGKESEFPNYVIYDDSKIETNFVEFNLENPTGKTMTTEQKAEVSKYIEKTLGPKVMQFFTDQMKGSGEWSRDVKNQNATIRIATTALNPLSVAHHEAMHEFFQRLLDGKYERAANVLRNAADSPLIKRQLQRHFATQPDVLKQIENDVEERIAYMFQLWAAGKLDIGTQTETVFRKIINVIRKVIGMVSQEKQLEEILQSFHDGKMSEPGAMGAVLDSQEARSKYLKRIGAKANPALKVANEWVGFAEGALTGQKNPHLDWIGRQLNNKIGLKGDAQGFLSAKEQANNLYMNKFATALKGIDPTGKDARVATKADVDLALEGLQKKTWHADPVVLRIQQQVAGVFKEMMQYMKDREIKVFNPDTKTWDEVREIKDYRIPRAWDPAQIIERSGEFKEMLLEHHEPVLKRIAKEANEEVAAGKFAGKYSASFDKLAHQDDSPATAEDVANAIVNRLINSNGQMELKEDSTALGFSPFARSVNERTLDWIDDAVFAEFMEKDIVKIISGYVGQITKRGEYSTRFGPDGGKLQAHMDAALDFEIDDVMESKYGIKGALKMAKDAASAHNTLAKKNKTPETTWQEQLGKLVDTEDSLATGKAVVDRAVQNLEPARKAVMAIEGTLGHDISALARKASAYTIVYQNVRLLGYALFSNFVDPLGMMVNGAEFKDAFAAFKRGMRDVGREWGDLTGLREKKETDDDAAVRVAEMIGTVDSAGFMSQMGTIYGSQYLPAWAKNVNDTFFRWNGLEAFNRAMRVQATQAAISFIKRHYEKPNEHSARYFEELGLSRDDVQINDKGELNVDNLKVQQGVMRWVDGAILRPNAAIRPTMSSDPHYAVFYHLKQFMYAMHAVILKRVQIEIKNGNTSPIMLLMAGYIPVMLAADAAKGLIQELTGGGAPYWQHGTMGDVLAHGVQRAGLLGVGQMGVDALQHGPLDLAGPAAEQVADLVTQPLGESLEEAVAVGPMSMLTKGPDTGSATPEG